MTQERKREVQQVATRAPDTPAGAARDDPAAPAADPAHGIETRLARELRERMDAWRRALYAFPPFARTLRAHWRTLRDSGSQTGALSEVARSPVVDALLGEVERILADYEQRPHERLERELRAILLELRLRDRVAEGLAYATSVGPSDPPEAARRLEDLRALHGAALEARNRFVERNLSLVSRLARSFSGRGVELADLEQEASLGLLRAAEKFDPGRGVHFASYAMLWVRQALIRAVQTQSRDVRLPIHVHELLVRARRLERGLAARGERASLEELAACLGVPAARLGEIEVGRGPALALDGPSEGDDAPPLVERIAAPRRDPDAALDRARLHPLLERWVERLPPRERTIVRARFGLGGGEPATLEELGTRLGLSSERVRQLEGRALGRLLRSARAGGVRCAPQDGFEPGDPLEPS